MSFSPVIVERMTPDSWFDVACILVRNISIGPTAIAAITRAAEPAARGTYASLICWYIGLLCEYRNQSYPAK